MGGGISHLPFLPLAPQLRGLTRRYGFEGLLAANINRDLRGLGFGLLGEVNFQHALITAGAHLPWFHGARKRE